MTIISIIACKCLALSSWETFSKRVVAHRITISPFLMFSLGHVAVNLLMPKWSLPLLSKGVISAHIEVDLNIKQCNIMCP